MPSGSTRNAYAIAFLAYEGPQGEKRYAAEKLTEQERLYRDVAYVAFRHAERQMKALEIQHSSPLSRLKVAMEM